MSKTQSFIDEGTGELKIRSTGNKTIYSIPLIALHFEAVTPHDTNPSITEPSLLFIGTGGTIKFDTPESTGITMTVPDGFEMKGLFTKVYATGTSATNIVAYR